MATDHLNYDYAALKTLTIGKRFPAGATTDAEKFLAMAYQQVWDAASWVFRRVSAAPCATVTGANAITLPVAATYGPLRRCEALYDEYGNELPYLAPREWQNAYRTSIIENSRGAPEAWTWSHNSATRSVLVGPLADAVRTLHMDFDRRLCHRSAAEALVAGPMAATDSQPLWPDHHRLLVVRAQVGWLKDLNDPTWPQFDEEYQTLLIAMMDDLLEDAPMQYGSIGAW